MNKLRIPLLEPGVHAARARTVFQCVIEAPRGSGVKIKYEPTLDAFVMGVPLARGRTYPFDWGFLPSTLGEDGDPLDAMVIHDGAGSPGLIVRVHLIGVLKVAQHKRGDVGSVRNDRYFVVPMKSRREDELRDVRQLSPHLREELEQFFIETAALSDKRLELLGWQGPDEATASLAAGARRAR